MAHQWFRSISGWLVRHRARIAQIGTGLFLYECTNYAYDFGFYPFALWYWGLWWGGVIVVAGSILQNAVMFWAYDHMKIDWLGAHALQELGDRENVSRFGRLAAWFGSEKRTWWERYFAGPLVFVLATLPIDPLIVAVHYRRQHFNGLGLGDWGILFAAVACANAWWLFKVGLVVEAAEWVFRFIQRIL